MAEALTIQNERYYKPFDNSDNPCCWQLEPISEDIEVILSEAGIEYESMFEDWGGSYSWTNSDGIEHSIMIECSDVDQAKYELQYWATRRKYFGLRREDVTESSDFEKILPALKNLNKKTQQAVSGNAEPTT